MVAIDSRNVGLCPPGARGDEHFVWRDFANQFGRHFSIEPNVYAEFGHLGLKPVEQLFVGQVDQAGEA